MGVCYDDVVASFQMVLGRSPDSEEAVNYHLRLGFRDRFELGAYMCATDEFRARFDAMVAEGSVAPSTRQVSDRQRPLTVFLGDRVLTETHRGLRIYVAPTDMDLAPHILLRGVWETHVEHALLRLLRPGMHAVDVGANIGYHTLTIGAAVGHTGSVHAFEASPGVARLLQASVFINGMSPWVQVHNRAAMDRDGMVILAAQPDHFGSGNVVPPGMNDSYHREYSNQVEVPGITLDAMLPQGRPLDLIRIDIEGSEPLALRGAAGLIQQSPNLRIVSEWSVGMMAVRTDLGAFVGWLEGLGFRFWLVTGTGGFESLTVSAMLELPHSDVLISRQDPG
ncbi:MAG: FkbM family methyltransferase [Belnapia sp.]|nr:FkbM family methyltransferase [Belnapia sp.]